MVDVKEGNPLLGHKLKTYHRRWFVLLYVCGINIVLLCGWNMFGTIAQTMKYGFEWENSTIANILNIGRIGIVAFLIPLNYILDTKGLRPAILVASSLALSCYVLRCFMDEDTSIWLAIVSEVLVGAGSCFSYSGPSKMSVTWFPPDERVSATSLAVMCDYLGFAISYILHPRVVSAPEFSNVDAKYNTSQFGSSNDFGVNGQLFNSSTDIVLLNKAEMQKETKTLIYTETWIVAFLWLVGILFLPKSPPTPPSVSASAERFNYTRVFMEVFRRRDLLIIVLYGGSLVGVYATWISVIDIALAHLGVSQTEAGLLGCYSITAGLGVGFVCARFSDVLGKKLKLILITMLTIASLSCLWLSLLCNQLIEFSTGQLYATSIIGCAFLNGCIPLFYEQMCEASFPIPEGIIIGLSALFTSVIGTIYLLPVSVVSMIDTSWLEWVLLGIGVLGVIVVSLVPQSYGRVDMDVKVEEKNLTEYNKLNFKKKCDKLVPDCA